MNSETNQNAFDKEGRIALAAIFSVLLAALEVAIDWSTWVELNVSIVYGLPLVLASVARSRRLLWILLLVLMAMTFAVYAAQIPAGKFTIHEPLFGNRVLSAFALVIATCILHVRLAALDKLTRQDEELKEAIQRLQHANTELIARDAQITCQNQELEFRRREAEEASQRKTKFMASVSHDIRTPINSINLMAEVMCHTAQNPTFAAEAPDIARRLQANALSLADLLTDVLDITRFDSGCVGLNPSRFSLNKLLNELCQALLPVAQAKGLSLQNEIPDELLWLYIDRVKLSRVVTNLLTNAIKYTDEGSVRARVIVTPDRAVSIEVHDTGIGIPPSALNGIFDEYAQLNNPQRDPNKGWGLGLPICKRLISLLGGTISVQSQLNVGSVFSIRLERDCLCEPFDQSSLSAANQPSVCTVFPRRFLVDDSASRAETSMITKWLSADATSTGPATHLIGQAVTISALSPTVLPNRRVLVVDDSRDGANSLRRMLGLLGAEVQVANDGAAALEMLKSFRPAVVLLDIGMPKMDGYEVARRIRSQSEFTDLMLIALTGRGQEQDRRRTAEAGFNHHLTKPADIKAIETLLSFGSG